MAKTARAPTKSEILNHIAKDTDLSRKQISGVLDSLNGIIKKSLRGHGQFTLPALVKPIGCNHNSLRPKLTTAV